MQAVAAAFAAAEAIHPPTDDAPWLPPAYDLAPSTPPLKTPPAEVRAGSPQASDSEQLDAANRLAERLLLDVAERDVELDAQAERHARELAERKWEAATPAERFWLAAPTWLRGLAYVGLALIVFLVR